MEERVQKLMAKAGLGSRRASEKIIRAGRVKINGKVATLGDKADLQNDDVTVDGRPLPKPEPRMYIMVHKPLDVISDDDDLGRRTVRDMVDVEGHLYPVGRLDKNSMGLILLTNDGRLAHLLTHPRYGHEKVYRAKVEGNPPNEVIHQWRNGIELDDGPTRRAGVDVLARKDDHTWLKITMKEGRKRQIRRMAAQLGYPIMHLERQRIGPLALGNLGLGKWRHLTNGEVERLKAYAEKGASNYRRRQSKKKGGRGGRKKGGRGRK